MRSEKERKRQRRLYIEGLQDQLNVDDDDGTTSFKKKLKIRSSSEDMHIFVRFKQCLCKAS